MAPRFYSQRNGEYVYDVSENVRVCPSGIAA